MGFLEINSQAITANYRTLQKLLGKSACAAVLKADAYGFGMDKIAPLLVQEGCSAFFVAHLDEALRLRGLVQNADIYVLSGLLPETEDVFVEHKLFPVLNDFLMLDAWGTKAQRIEKKLPCAMHVDTGMNRCGFDEYDLTRLKTAQGLLDAIHLKLLMSHLVSSQDAADPRNAQQKEKFETIRFSLPSAPASLADTGGIFLGAPYHYDVARPGKGIFGLHTPPKKAPHLLPSLKVFGRVIQVRKAKKGESVGYGASHTLSRDSTLATLGIGFADGYPRSLSNKAYVNVQGFKAPILGRISMDYTVIDVTDIPESLCFPGGWVELVNEDLNLNKLAEWMGGISRELSTGFSPRMQKIYK